MLKSNYGLILAKDIALLLNKNIGSIIYKANAIGLKSNRSLLHKKYTINDDYFKIPNLQNSYWAGFLAADGCIDDGVRPRIRLKLSNKDKTHLETFQSHCNYDGPLYHFTQSNKEYCSFETRNKEWVKDLKDNFKITSRKTFTLSPPNLSQENSLAFICGYIDGDGCISIDRKTQRSNSKLRLSLIGTKEILVWIKLIFDKICDKFNNANVAERNNMSFYVIAGYKAKFILNHLNKMEIPYLYRKWNKLKCSTIT